MKLDKKNVTKWIIAVIVASVAALGVITVGYFVGNTASPVMGTVILPRIKVYVKGEIKTPGLYEVDADTRLCEIIDIAGGTTEVADADRLNLAAILIDGTTIKIPAVGSEEPVDPMIAETSESTYRTSSSPAPDASSGKITSGTININTAGVADLMRLPGIGESTANKIISYRTSSGGFMAIEEIMNVSGIGEKKFESMKQYLSIN